MIKRRFYATTTASPDHWEPACAPCYTRPAPKPFTNIVRVDPVGGAYRVNDAALVNATIYPVKSEHIVCEQYNDRTNRKRVANKYACFKNRDGEWVCGADGIPKITQLN